MKNEKDKKDKKGKKGKRGKRVTSSDFKRYLDESEGFERDWIAELHKSRRTAWIVAIVGTCVGVVGVVTGLVGVTQTPPPPLVVRIDSATGASDPLGVMPIEVQSYDEQTDKYWLNNFMLCREGYDWNTIKTCYDKVGLMSNTQVQDDYARVYNDVNGRHIKLANRARVIPHIISITPHLEDGTATIRFTTQLVHENGTKEPPRRFVATLAYRYVYDAKLTEAQRLLNLLGFQVTSYRVDDEF